MGFTQLGLDVPATRGTSGLLLLRDEDVALQPEGPCIRCARCVQACPMNLLPTTIAAYARRDLSWRKPPNTARWTASSAAAAATSVRRRFPWCRRSVTARRPYSPRRGKLEQSESAALSVILAAYPLGRNHRQGDARRPLQPAAGLWRGGLLFRSVGAVGSAARNPRLSGDRSGLPAPDGAAGHPCRRQCRDHRCPAGPQPAADQPLVADPARCGDRHRHRQAGLRRARFEPVQSGPGGPGCAADLLPGADDHLVGTGAARFRSRPGDHRDAAGRVEERRHADRAGCPSKCRAA